MKNWKVFVKERSASKKRNEEINMVGICGTDLRIQVIRRFTYPRILGHELASEVLEIGENEKGIKE